MKHLIQMTIFWDETEDEPGNVVFPEMHAEDFRDEDKLPIGDIGQHPYNRGVPI